MRADMWRNVRTLDRLCSSTCTAGARYPRRRRAAAAGWLTGWLSLTAVNGSCTRLADSNADSACDDDEVEVSITADKVRARTDDHTRRHRHVIYTHCRHAAPSVVCDCVINSLYKCHHHHHIFVYYRSCRTQLSHTYHNGTLLSVL